MSSVTITMLAVVAFGIGVGAGYILAALMRPDEPVPKARPGARNWREYEAEHRRDDGIEHQTGAFMANQRDYRHRYDGMDDRDSFH